MGLHNIKRELSYPPLTDTIKQAIVTCLSVEPTWKIKINGRGEIFILTDWEQRRQDSEYQPFIEDSLLSWRRMYGSQYEDVPFTWDMVVFEP